MPNFISEQQIERALVQKLQHLYGYDSLDCYTEDPEDLNDGSGRANKREVILVDRVREAAVRLNPNIPAKAIEDALEKLLDGDESERNHSRVPETYERNIFTEKVQQCLQSDAQLREPRAEVGTWAALE